MKKLVKFISVLLCFVILCTAVPVTVFAQADTPQNLRYEADEWGENRLVWDNVYSYDHYNIYASTDGINFTLVDSRYSNEYYISSDAQKGIYHYYVSAVTEGWYEDYCDAEGNVFSTYHSAEESAPSNIAAVHLYDNYAKYCYAYAENGKLKISWTSYESELRRIDGYQIFQSTNGGAFVPVAQVSAQTYTINQYGDYCFSCTMDLPATPANYKFTVASYTVLGGITHCNPDFTMYDEYIVYMPDPVLTTKTKSEIIKWTKVSGADSYVIYGGTSYSNIKKLAVVSGKKTSYTVKNVNNYKKDYVYYVACVNNGFEFSKTRHMSASDGEARMRAATRSKKKKNTVTVWNTRPSKSRTAWVTTITKKDRKILAKFAKKHFKKGWTSIQKAEYTLEWINKNVTYASGTKYNKIARCSYVEAIFNKKLGQCLQYNGAYAMMLTYLGYEARIIQGWRGSSMKNKWSHYWCEIKVDGKWYLMETGNYDDSGSWMYFCQPYRNAGGYLINKKVAK